MADYLLQWPKRPKARFLAALSYLGILCLVPLVVGDQDSYVRFHARQGMVLWIWGLFSVFALHLPGVGPFFFGISIVAIMLISISGMILAGMGKAWRLPVIATLAEKL